MQPRFPLYIPSKGRHESRYTIKALERIGVPYHVVVEENEYDAYRSVVDPDYGTVLVLDPAYQRDYDMFWDFPESASRGPGPSRNFIWDHSIAQGHKWHWIMDDNIRGFFRLNRHRKLRMADGTHFRVMEDFCLRYMNVAMAGPNYAFCVRRKQVYKPVTFNTRIYSCNLIRNDVPFRWRGRYNEDTDLSIRMLKEGWCTVLFNCLLQDKVATQTLPGGNTDAFYASEGTLPKSRMLVHEHPDVTRLMYRFGRWHHYFDLRPFRKNKLVKRPGLVVPTGVNEYGMQEVPRFEEDEDHA